MKKVISINFQGQVIAIEETAYEILKQYIESLKSYFLREEDGTEIVNDIENRIAELFGNRLKLGINCITDEDVESIVASIGRPEDFDSDFEGDISKNVGEEPKKQSGTNDFNPSQEKTPEEKPDDRHLYRNSTDKILGGVCSGIAHYLRIDPAFVRLAFVLLFSVLFWVYLILWIILKPMPLASNIAKRLYRNPSDKVLGGVCGGIATYFKIDSWIPRLIFILPLITNLFGMFSIPFFPWNHIFDKVDFNFNLNGGVVIAYIVLWVIIPKASSVKQKLEMMGEEQYIKSIRDTVSDNVASVKSKTEADAPEPGFSPGSSSIAQANAPRREGEVFTMSPSATGSMPPEPPKTSAQKEHHISAQKTERSGCLTALVVFLKIIFFGFVGIFAVSVAAMFVAFMVAGVSLMHLQSLFIDHGVENTLFWITVVCLFGIPSVAAIVWLVRRIAGAKSRPVVGYVAMGLWAVGLVAGIALASKVLNKYKVESSSEQTFALSQPSVNKLYVDMEPYPSDYYSVKTSIGDGDDISGLPYYTENEDSLLFASIDLKIVESRDSLFHVRATSVCSGKSPKDAKRYMADFAYPIRQQDSVLLLPEFLRAPMSQGFRMQGVEVEIAVPAGKRIEVDDRLKSYKNHNRIQSGRKNKREKVGTRRSKPSKWNPDEEYIMRDGQLTETAMKTDSI